MAAELLPDNQQQARNDGRVFAMMAEFADVDSIMSATEKVRDANFTLWDVHAPFPLHGLPKAMGLRPTILPWISLAHGLAGVGAGLLLVWWTNAVTISGVPTELQGYQYLISGKPRFSFAANIPILFELGVLFAALGTLLGLLGLNKLPMLHNPLFASRRFRRATSDRFFIVIEAKDPQFDTGRTADFLRSLGALSVEQVMDTAA
jgi:hypothetical protein